VDDRLALLVGAAIRRQKELSSAARKERSRLVREKRKKDRDLRQVKGLVNGGGFVQQALTDLGGGLFRASFPEPRPFLSPD